MTKINNLTIVSSADDRITPSGQKLKRLHLICFCGKKFIAFKGNIMTGHTRSCGCLQPPGYHGMRNTPIYRVWDAMMQRCYNPKTKAYKNYGGRGILVCKSWHTFINFNDWCVNNGYKNGLELDREKNNKGYCPSNCRFVTHSTNNRNTRRNVKYFYKGKNRTIAELSEISGVKFEKLRYRMNHGWIISEALIN